MDDLKKAILEKSFEADGKLKLRCLDAYKIAEEHAIKISEVGRICHAENIRVCTCQLKCFD